MKNTDEEKFAPIDGFNDYLVSSHGRVLSLKYNNIRELKQCKNNSGYLTVNLYKNNKNYNVLVSRLVAQAFIPNPDNKAQVNHIDENIINNHVSNLEWMTCKENNNHGTRNKRISKAHIGKHRTEETKQKISEIRINEYKNGFRNCKGVNNPKAKSVIAFKINGCDIKYYKYIKESEKDNFSPSCISKCCRKEMKTHKGYVWFYADEFFNKKE